MFVKKKCFNQQEALKVRHYENESCKTTAANNSSGGIIAIVIVIDRVDSKCIIVLQLNHLEAKCGCKLKSEKKQRKTVRV